MVMMMSAPPNESWHLEKRFSIALLLGMLVHLLGLIVGGTMLYSEIKTDHETLQVLISWRDKQDDERAHIDSHLAVIDQRLADQSDTLRHIDERQERFLNRH